MPCDVVRHDDQMATKKPPYRAPGKCEAQIRKQTGAPSLLPASQIGRCAKPPTAWNEKQYAWLCSYHDKLAKKRKR